MTTPEQTESTSPLKKKSKLYAYIAALFAPGAGHVVLGRPVRGAIWFGALFVGILITPYVPFMTFGLFALWLGGLIDVGRVKPKPPLLPHPKSSWLVAGAVVGVIVVLVGLRTLYIEAYKLPSGGMIPTLSIHDHIFVNKASYWFGGPARGDVIVFDNPCQPDVTFIKRVIARGGDTVEVRCERVYVNGEQLSLEPDGDSCSYWDFDADANHWEQKECARYREGDYSVVFRDALEDRWDRHDFPEIGASGEPPRQPECYQREAAPRPPGVFEPVDGPNGECDQQLAYRVPKGHVFVMGDNRSNTSDSRVWGSVPEGNVTGRATVIWWPGRQGPEGGTDWGRISRIE